MSDIPKVTNGEIEAAFDWETFDREAEEKYIKDAAYLSEGAARGVIYLTAGELRKQLESVSDDAPILYQRIEDKYFDNHTWKTVSLTWEREGEYSEYILPFGCHKHETADGQEVFVLNAHY